MAGVEAYAVSSDDPYSVLAHRKADVFKRGVERAVDIYRVGVLSAHRLTAEFHVPYRDILKASAVIALAGASLYLKHRSGCFCRNNCRRIFTGMTYDSFKRQVILTVLYPYRVGDEVFLPGENDLSVPSCQGVYRLLDRRRAIGFPVGNGSEPFGIADIVLFHDDPSVSDYLI